MFELKTKGKKVSIKQNVIEPENMFGKTQQLVAMETGLLTNKQRQQLATVISSRDMEIVALGYLDIDGAVIERVRDEHFGKAEEVQAEACNTALLQRWVNRAENSGPHQIKVSSAHRARYTVCALERGAHGISNSVVRPNVLGNGSSTAAAAPGFSRWGRQPQNGGANLIFGHISPKTA